MDYDFITIIKLVAATILPVLLSAAVYLAEKKTKFGRIKYIYGQIIIGLLFGGVAILGTQFGIPLKEEGAVINVRNAAPLTAGLIFGAPAGIISGVIGGVYRYAATCWGVGAFSREACTIGCVLAGLFGAGCRKFMFGNKKPTPLYGFAIGGTTEVLHMLLVFLTNMNDVFGAYKVVAACAQPMIICNAVSVMLSLAVVSLIGKERIKNPLKTKQISQMFQLFLTACVLLASAATMIFTASLQTKIAYANADKLLEQNLGDAVKEVSDAIEKGGDIENEIRRSVSYRRIGQNGGIIVCGDDGKVIYDNGNHIGDSVDLKKNADFKGVEQGVRFTATIGDAKSLCMYEKVGNYYLIADIPSSEAMFSRNIAVTILAFMETIVFAALFAHVYFLLKILIVDNIHKINDSLSEITDGNLGIRVNVRKNEEFASLSDDINATVDTLKRYIAEAEGRIDRELEFARQIQLSALPSVFPPYPERKDFEIYAETNAAKEVGGDFYDFYLTDKNKFAFLVADVSGKGIPAALFMMRSKTLLKNLVESGKSIEEAMAAANAALSDHNDAEMFVTVWLGKLDLETGELEYVNAGHNPPLIRKNGGEFEYLRTRPNFILAGMSGTKYRKNSVTLGAGDEIFLYTDGVTEATDGKNELYGENRLKNALCVLHGVPKSICDGVEEDIKKFVGEAEQSDDITMLCVKYNGGEKVEKITSENPATDVGEIENFVSETLEKWNVPSAKSNKAGIIADEIFSNVARYSGAKRAEVILKSNGGKLSLIFKDDGAPYNPLSAADPDVTLSADERKIGGLGIFMVKKLAEKVEYKYENGENVVMVTL